MKVTFKRSGGFAPMPLSGSIDTDTSSTEDAVKLQQLVESSGIMQAESASIPGACDIRYYTVEIESQSETKKVKFDELSVPPAVRPLIEFLQERASGLFAD